MGVRNQNSTNYVHNDEPNLLNLHKAMQYNTNGEPELRVHAGGITISGNVNVDKVRVWDGTNDLILEQPNNDSDSPNIWAVPTENHNMVFNGSTWDRMRGTIADGILVEISNSSIAVTDNGGSLTVDGTVNIGTMPEVEIKNDTGNPIPISGTVSINQPVAVTDNNTTLSIDDGGGSITVDGTVTANVTFPTSQTINGNVGLLVGGQPLATGNPIPVDITDTCLKIMNCDNTRLNTNANAIILVNELPVAGSNPLPVTLGDVCLTVENCEGTFLKIEGDVGIISGEDPVSLLNPLPVSLTNECISVQNCGTDGVLNIGGNISVLVEGIEVTVENPFPVDLRNNCIGVQNCEGTELDVNITNTSIEVKLTDGANDIGFVLNDNDGQTANTWSVPVENFNMVWNGSSWDRMPGNAIAGVSVNITNSCLSVANCADTVLNVAGDMNLLINGSEVTADNPVPVTFPNCVSIQNCGESTLGINGTVGLQYDGQVVDDGHPLPVTGTFEISDGKVQAVLGGTNLDAFGRLRTSEPITLFDSNFRYADDTANWNHTLTGVSSSVNYNSNTKTIDLTVSALNGEVIRETTKVFQYQPGKSLLIMTTFSMAPDPFGEIEQRVGYFGERNGVYFQTTGNQYSFVIRKDITGTIDSSTEKKIQSSWNGDRLTGLGGANNPSGYTLNPTITQIFWTDIEWLGVGSVRCGFVIDGKFIVCHTFHHANDSVLSLTGPYMATASLPIRYEIKRTGGEGTATLRQICSTVISEGGYQPKSTVDTASMGVTTKNLTTAGTYYPLVSIRLNSTRLDAIVRLATLQSMIATASSSPKNCHFQILRNATLAGGTWVTHPKGTVDYNLSLTGAVNGTIIGSGYFSASTRAEISGIADIDYQLGRTLGGVSDTFTIVATPDSNNLDVAIDLGWFDLSL